VEDVNNEEGRNNHRSLRKEFERATDKAKEDYLQSIIQRIKEAKDMFNNKKQLLCLNNLSLELKKKLIKSCIWSVAVCGSETGTVGKNEERVTNGFETRCWRRKLKINGKME
jgi:hypothetical protein